MGPEIRPQEKLYRALKPTPAWWKDGKPSSAIFKDSKGVSVDRDGGRSTDEIVSNFESRMGRENLKAVAIIKVEQCTAHQTIVLHRPIDGNEYHAEIHRSNSEIQLTSSQAKKLIRCCDFVFLDQSNAQALPVV